MALVKGAHRGYERDPLAAPSGARNALAKLRDRLD
jgi:hypothetical protein